MSIRNFTIHNSHRGRLMASAAVLALVVAGASGEGRFFRPTSARAAAVDTSGLPTQSMPSFAPIVDRVMPAVVSVKVDIEATGDTANGQMQDIPPEVRRFFKRFEGQNGMDPRMVTPQPEIGLGSGFFISQDGYIVTNNHVVDNARDVTVTMSDGKTLAAKVVGTDRKTDLAVLKVDAKGDYPFVSFAKEAPKIGDWVVAVGNPFGLGGTVTAGIVSANGRDIGAGPYENFMQIDAPINKGNSGGPTFNLQGHVVGVNSEIMSPSGGSVGVAFDIPASTVESVADELEHGGVVARGYLGVLIQPVSQDIAEGLGLKTATGALVDKTEPGTPAAQGGLQSGDVITKLNGQEVVNSAELTRRIGALKPGSKVDLTYLRNGAQKTAELTLAAQPTQKMAMANPSPGGPPMLGLQLAPAGEVSGAGDRGVAVVGVDPNGEAAQKGVTDGDVILQVGGNDVSSPAEIRADMLAAKQQGRKAVLMKIKTAQGERFIAFAFGNS